METIIIESEGQSLEKIKAFLKEMNVSFKTKIKKEKRYDPEFVKMVLESAKSDQRRVLDDNYKKELFG